MIDRFIGRSAVVNTRDNEGIAFDLGAFLRRLLLFDTYILDSIRLKEIPFLVATFGVRGLETLLSSGCLRIYCHVLAVGQVGQTSVLKYRQSKGILPLGSYSFASLTQANPAQYLHDCLKSIDRCEGISFKERKALKRSILPALVEPPTDGGAPILEQLKIDIVNNSELVKAMVTSVLRKEHGVIISPDEFTLIVEAIDDVDFQTRTNLGDRLGRDAPMVHKVLEVALLGVGGLNQRVHQMKTYHALTGLTERDVSLFGNKLEFLARTIDPTGQERRFERVREVAGLPDVMAGERNVRVDVERLLAVRASKECREFRAWLRNVDSLSDKEVQEVVNGVRNRLGTLANLPTVRGLRFLVGSGVSMLPGAGPVLGTIAGLIDSFLVERVLPYSGPAAFVERMYPSIFEEGR